MKDLQEEISCLPHYKVPVPPGFIRQLGFTVLRYNHVYNIAPGPVAVNWVSGKVLHRGPRRWKPSLPLKEWGKLLLIFISGTWSNSNLWLCSKSRMCSRGPASCKTDWSWDVMAGERLPSWFEGSVPPGFIEQSDLGVLRYNDVYIVAPGPLALNEWTTLVSVANRRWRLSLPRKGWRIFATDLAF